MVAALLGRIVRRRGEIFEDTLCILSAKVLRRERAVGTVVVSSVCSFTRVDDTPNERILESLSD